MFLKKFFFFRILCETVKDFTMRLAHTSLAQGDDHFSEKCQILNNKLHMLVQILEEEGGITKAFENKTQQETALEEPEKLAKEKQEKDIINLREKSVSA